MKDMIIDCFAGGGGASSHLKNVALKKMMEKMMEKMTED